MTHPAWKIDLVLALRECGLGARRIGRELGLPVRTVTDWLAGRLPSAPTRGERCGTCRHESHPFEDLPPEYVYLLGLYLGDGCIATHPRAYKLRIALDAAYPGIIAETESAIRAVLPANSVNKVLRPRNNFEVYCYSKSWPCLFPQHGPGKKHLRQIMLADWQRELVNKSPHLLLRGLIHSDGCRFMNTGRGWRYPRYSFTNLSSDIRGIFTEACDLLELRWTRAPQKIYVSRKADVDRMDQFIGPKT